MKLVWFLTIVFVQKSLQKEEGAIPVGVTRRSTSDIVFFDEKSEHTVCYVTYLVEERQCVSDQDVINGCSSAIIPIESMSPVALTTDPSTSSSVIAPIKTAEADGDAIFHFREANQTISSSHCQISSLEVYRGREQVIKISHEGFLLSGSGSIEINYSEGAYTREEYSGELYRMNLSCSGGGLPESGCLFFKVGGKSNITNAKFNCTVPGTLAKECHNSPTTTNTISATTSPTITISSKPTTASSSLSPTSGFEVGRTYFLIVVICGVLGAALIVAIVLVCFMVCLLRRRMRPSSVQTAPLEAESCKQESSLQDLGSKQLEGRYDTVAQEYETVISNGGMAGGESHIYAALESPKNPRHYSDPIKSNPRISKERSHSNALEKRPREHMPVPGAQYYDNPTNMQESLNQPQLDQIPLAEGLSGDVLEHKYAKLERQPLAQMRRQSLTQEGEGHQYDAPPREDENDLRSHPSDKDDPAQHVYAILEKQ